MPQTIPHPGVTPEASAEVSVILVNWNTAGLANAAIASLKRHEASTRLEIIVVDNASSGDDGDRILREHPDVRLVRSDRNLGFAGGNNLGARAATGEFLLLLNTDTLFTEPVLPACIAVAREHAPAVTACRLRNADGSLQLSAERFPRLRDFVREIFTTAEKLNRIKSDALPSPGDGPAAVDWLCGAFLLVPRATYLELGGLSEAIFMYGEDTEFCWRARKRGIPSLYVPGVAITHLGGGGINHASYRSLRVADTGRLVAFRLMRGAAAAFGLRLVFMARSALRVAGWGLAGILRRDAARLRKAGHHAREILALAGIVSRIP